MTGSIKWYDKTKGFGFIVTDDNTDVFVHRSGVPTGLFLEPGQRVEFDVKDGEKGPVATNVKAI